MNKPWISIEDIDAYNSWMEEQEQPILKQWRMNDVVSTLRLFKRRSIPWPLDVHQRSEPRTPYISDSDAQRYPQFSNMFATGSWIYRPQACIRFEHPTWPLDSRYRHL